jgi:2-methylisocitrate lyase-like PEP mutase family enzyme
MSSRYQTFKKLHTAKDFFVLPNAWDAKSAILFQEKQFPAIATSSSAVASSLGYEDGEQMPFGDYLFVIQRIAASIQVPFSVDLEMGYGATKEEIYFNIRRLIDLGVIGINIEDSVIRSSVRTLNDAAAFAQTIAFIRNQLTTDHLDLFINIRCDTFILNVEKKLEEAITRIQLYEAAGADGIFLPCISGEEDIAAIIAHTRLPLNVMAIPGLPGFDVLNRLGVQRVSMGPFLFGKTYDHADQLIQKIRTDQHFSSIVA